MKYTMLTEKELATWLKCSTHKLSIDRRKGRGIHFYKLGRHVRYSLKDISKYLENKKILSKEG